MPSSSDNLITYNFEIHATGRFPFVRINNSSVGLDFVAIYLICKYILNHVIPDIVPAVVKIPGMVRVERERYGSFATTGCSIPCSYYFI